MGLRLAALRAAGAPLLSTDLNHSDTKEPTCGINYRMNTEKRTLTNCSRNRYQIRIWLAATCATCRNHMLIHFKIFCIFYTTIFNNRRNIVNSIFFIFFQYFYLSFSLLFPFTIIITILFCDYSCKVAG